MPSLFLSFPSREGESLYYIDIEKTMKYQIYPPPTPKYYPSNSHTMSLLRNGRSRKTQWQDDRCPRRLVVASSFGYVQLVTLSVMHGHMWVFFFFFFIQKLFFSLVGHMVVAPLADQFHRLFAQNLLNIFSLFFLLWKINLILYPFKIFDPFQFSYKLRTLFKLINFILIYLILNEFNFLFWNFTNIDMELLEW